MDVFFKASTIAVLHNEEFILAILVNIIKFDSVCASTSFHQLLLSLEVPPNLAQHFFAIVSCAYLFNIDELDSYISLR